MAFLRGIAAHQDRDWYEANKAVYEAQVRGPQMALVADLGPVLADRGLPLQGDPRRALFRLHRDIRFSKDKRPYKTHAGAALTRDGAKMSPGVLYIHVDPEGSFVAAGFYQPEPTALAAIRSALAAKPAAFPALQKRLAAAGLPLEPDGEALKRLPRGYEGVSDPVLGEALRRRSFIVRRPLAAEALADPGLVDQIAAFAGEAAPLLAFGWAAIDTQPRAR